MILLLHLNVWFNLCVSSSCPCILCIVSIHPSIHPPIHPSIHCIKCIHSSFLPFHLSICSFIHLSSTDYPTTEFNSNSNTILILTKHGGHFGFLEGLYPRGSTWMNRVTQQYLDAMKIFMKI